MTTPLRQSKLPEQLAVQISSDIVTGRLEVGAAIPAEPELVATYGASKTVVRETIQALSAVGLVRVQQGKRTVVLPEEEWNILSPLLQQAYREQGLAGEFVTELYEVRRVLEPMAARWAAAHASRENVEEITRILGAMRLAAEENERRRFLDCDREFHFIISDSSGNRVLRAIIRDIHELVQSGWLLTALSGNDTRTVFDQHSAIAEAIADGDVDRAEKTMRDHVEWAASTDRSIQDRGFRNRERRRLA